MRNGSRWAILSSVEEERECTRPSFWVQSAQYHSVNLTAKNKKGARDIQTPVGTKSAGDYFSIFIFASCQPEMPADMCLMFL